MIKKLEVSFKTSIFIFCLHFGFLEENIKNFLNPCKVQVKLWRRLVDLMKEDTDLPVHIREELTDKIAQCKWLSLKKDFKAAYYNSSVNKSFGFPYYDVMFKMFSEFAEVKLNESNMSLNETTQAEISAYVEELLEQSVSDISVLRCDPLEDNKQNLILNKTSSEASKVRRQIAGMPEECVSIMKANLKIVPNTPFNRKCQISTIVNHRNLMISSFKRSNSDEQFSQKKYKISEPWSNNEITILDSFDDENDASGYKIEALDDCNLSHIFESHIKPETKPIKIENVTKFSLPDLKNVKKILKSSNGRLSEFKPTKILKHESTRLHNDIAMKASLHVLNNDSSSILEVPTFESSGEVESITTQNSFEQLRAAPESRNVSAARIVPKKLNWEHEPSISINQSSHQNTPEWFKHFLNRYESDMTQINVRINDIDGKLDKILSQTSTPFVIQRSIP